MRLFVLCTILLLAAGCREAETAAPVETGAAEQPDTPEDRAGVIADSTVTADSTGLVLVDNLPIGATVDQVREVLPTLQMTEGEAAVEDDMEQAVAPYTLFDRMGEVELNFEGGRLVSYFFRLDPLACASADSLYGRVQATYSERFGVPGEEVQDEGGYRARSSYWRGDSLGASVTRGEQDGRCRLAWGFQTEAP